MDTTNAFDEVIVGQGVGEAQEAGGAEGLARDRRDLDLVEDQVGELARRVGDAASERTR